MEDKIFESARMTAALDDDQGAYEAIPAVNIFDAGLENTKANKRSAMTARRRRRSISGWWVVAPLMVGGAWFCWDFIDGHIRRIPAPVTRGGALPSLVPAA